MSTQSLDELYIKRCFTLARYGTNRVKTNPRVGCVIVHDDIIIGEGYHEAYGSGHAEVNAFNSVSQEKRALLPDSTLYVSLEPCHHKGKTPPCVDAIIKHNIKRVVISCLDPNPLTYGKSVQKLKEHDIDVTTDVLLEEGSEVIREFVVNLSSHRPYVMLKWAQSKDGYISKKGEQTWLSNDLSKWTTHRWRSEVDAILVGTDTAIIDNPKLTNRRGFGNTPVRILLDRQCRVPADTHLIADDEETIIFTCHENYQPTGKKVIQLSPEAWSWDAIFSALLDIKISSVMVEGGKKILKSLITESMWDEARIIHTEVKLGSGVKAPSIQGSVQHKHKMKTDTSYIIRPNHRD